MDSVPRFYLVFAYLSKKELGKAGWKSMVLNQEIRS